MKSFVKYLWHIGFGFLAAVLFYYVTHAYVVGNVSPSSEEWEVLLFCFLAALIFPSFVWLCGKCKRLVSKCALGALFSVLSLALVFGMRIVWGNLYLQSLLRDGETLPFLLNPRGGFYYNNTVFSYPWAIAVIILLFAVGVCVTLAPVKNLFYKVAEFFYLQYLRIDGVEGLWAKTYKAAEEEEFRWYLEHMPANRKNKERLLNVIEQTENDEFYYYFFLRFADTLEKEEYLSHVEKYIAMFQHRVEAIKEYADGLSCRMPGICADVEEQLGVSAVTPYAKEEEEQ